MYLIWSCSPTNYNCVAFKYGIAGQLFPCKILNYKQLWSCSPTDKSTRLIYIFISSYVVSPTPLGNFSTKLKVYRSMRKTIDCNLIMGLVF